ncbi:MAG TPA: HPF/RaiA family ribosome-associated protein [Tepidisphaeraceae bacterium]|nr:HPF/RaiA family ribosome-associated protein [Tepidisphaeraceae bacterium]
MFIDVRAIGFPLSDAIRTHVQSRVNSALGPFARRVVTVTARLEDINADHGGVDKRCSLVAAVRQRGTVVTEAVHEDLYSAADEAAARLRRAVQRLLSRRIGRERKYPQRPGALVTP